MKEFKALNKKFINGTITVEELRRLAELKANRSKHSSKSIPPKQPKVTVEITVKLRVFGRIVEISRGDYLEREQSLKYLLF